MAQNNTNQAAASRTFKKYTASDYDILVPDDPKPVKYVYRNVENEKRRRGTKTCSVCHQYKNGTGHAAACPGPCKGIDECPTEYFSAASKLNPVSEYNFFELKRLSRGPHWSWAGVYSKSKWTSKSRWFLGYCKEPGARTDQDCVWKGKRCLQDSSCCTEGRITQ